MTALHLFAQHLLVDRKALTLPPVAGGVGNERIERFPTRVMAFEASVMEKAAGSLRPDVTLTAGASALYVEVLVTHACPTEKVAAMRAAGNALLEIDLSKTDRDIDLPGLEAWVIHEAPRRWLYNRHIDEIETEIVERRAERRRVQALKEERNILAAGATLKVAYRKAERAALADNPQADPQVRRAEEGGWKGLISGFDALAPGLFTVHPDRWRSHVLTSVLHEYYGRTADDVAELVTRARMVNRKLTGRSLDDHAVAARAGLPTADAVVVIENYLEFIERSGAARSVGGYWRLDLSIRHMLNAQNAREAGREAEIAGRDWRIRHLDRFVEDISSKLPAYAAFGAKERAWLNAPLMGSTPMTIAQTGGDRWSELERGLTAILKCLHDGAPDQAPSDLGLPFVCDLMDERIEWRRERARALAEAERRRENERARLLERQADERATAIKSEAAGRLFDEAGGWLATALPHEAGLPEAAALRSPRGLEEAREALEKATQRRKRRLDALEALEAFAAQHIARADARDLMLKSAQPRLFGASMLSYCKNEVTLQACKDLIKPPPKRKR